MPSRPSPPLPLQRHARDIDERRNRLTQDQLAARNQALHRTMQVGGWVGACARRLSRAPGRGWQAYGWQACGCCLPLAVVAQPHAHRLRRLHHSTDPLPPLPCLRQVLLHASECVDNKCPSTSCHRVKAMYHHAMNCPTKLSGNCQYCRRMWMLLQMHATQCTVPHCQVPRCIQLRTIRRRQATRQEDKRRAAYRNMLQQQMGR